MFDIMYINRIFNYILRYISKYTHIKIYIFKKNQVYSNKKFNNKYNMPGENIKAKHLIYDKK